MLITTVFLLDILDSNSLHGPVRELHQDNGTSNQIKSIQSKSTVFSRPHGAADAHYEPRLEREAAHICPKADNFISDPKTRLTTEYPMPNGK
jgi:hypothetical protein